MAACIIGRSVRFNSCVLLEHAAGKQPSLDKLMSDDFRKISVLTGTHLHGVGSCACHSELTEEM